MTWMHGAPQAKQVVELKAGAQVMLTRSISANSGLVNGARGVVERFVGKSIHLPVVRFASVRLPTNLPTSTQCPLCTWQLVYAAELPRVVQRLLQLHLRQFRPWHFMWTPRCLHAGRCTAKYSREWTPWSAACRASVLLVVLLQIMIWQSNSSWVKTTAT